MDNGDNYLPDQQVEMEVFSLKEAEVEGLQMGVLNNGTPYLTMRGLSRLCGVDSSAIVRLTTDWIEERNKPRGKKIDEILQNKGLKLTKLYWTVRAGETEVRAYPSSVCMAILEYYAFESEQTDRTIALKNFRTLGDSALKRLIFLSVGIDPENPQRSAWQAFHDRLRLNSQTPLGYFSVFSEMADLSLKMISSGFNFGPAAVPDISVGRFWSEYWSSNNLDQKYGKRTKYPHMYPDWYPQHRAGPQETWVYPDDALGEFRRWIQKSYLPIRFPAYIESKARDGSIPQVNALQLLTKLKKKEISHK